MSQPNCLSRALFLLGLPMAAGMLSLGYGWAIEPAWWEVKKVVIRSRRLPAEFNGYTIAQISDLHLSPYNRAEKLRAAINQVQDLQANMIVLTGDYVSTLKHGEAKVLAEELARLSAPDGVYAILGNHDWWTDAKVVVGALRQAGVTTLQNEHVAIRRGLSRLYLAGVDDVMEARADLRAALQGVPEDAGVVLLAHEPDYADLAARDARVFLQLSGHVHGGQVRLPGMAPFARPPWGEKYPDGWYRVKKLQLYVNRGLGVSFPPVRLFCRPEVTLAILKAA